MTEMLFTKNKLNLTGTHTGKANIRNQHFNYTKISSKENAI
jgi:hypothetical protein